MIVIQRGAAGFEAAWRALPATAGEPPATPAAIVRPRSPAEVVAAVERARDRGLPVTVRSGGHSLCGSYVRDGAVVLDLRRMSAVAVDLGSGTARIGPGATSLAAGRALDAARAAFPVGHSPAVGLGGFLLAGGNGWGGPWWGAAAHRIEAATVVTGDGQLRRVDASSDPELLWAIRGAGAAFPGVVTEFVVGLAPVRGAVERALVTEPGSAADRLGERLDDLGPAAGIELTVLARPGPDGGTFTVVATGFAPPADRAAVAGELLRSLGSEPVSARRYPGIGAMLSDIDDFAEDVQRSDHRWTVSSWRQVLTGLPMNLPSPSPHSSLLVAPAPRPLTDAALYAPPPTLGVSGYAHLSEPATPDAVDRARSWIQQALSPLPSTGRYIGEADLLPDAGGLARCLSAAAVARLRRLRARVDPSRTVACALDLPTPPT